MNKITYPRDGLYIYCQVNCENIISSLERAERKCTFVITENYEYKAYLLNLENVIKKYKSEMQSINETLINVNKRFEELSDTMYQRVKNLDSIKIEYRDRMIK